MRVDQIKTIALSALIGLVLVSCTDDSGAGDIIDYEQATIEVMPNPLAFPYVALGESALASVRVSNSGRGVLKITSVELIEDTDRDEGGQEFQRSGVWQDGVEVKTGESIDLEVVYSPVDHVQDSGRIVIQSNAPNGTFTIPITTEEHVCPKAIALASEGAPPQLKQEVEVVVSTPALLDGTQSVAAHGNIASYEWAFVERPINSNARLQPSVMAPTPSVFLDLPGVYVLELTVYDDEGMASCNDEETRRVTISVLE